MTHSPFCVSASDASQDRHPLPTRRSSDLHDQRHVAAFAASYDDPRGGFWASIGGRYESGTPLEVDEDDLDELVDRPARSEEHTSELQSHVNLVCRLLLEKRKSNVSRASSG